MREAIAGALAILSISSFGCSSSNATDAPGDAAGTLDTATDTAGEAAADASDGAIGDGGAETRDGDAADATDAPGDADAYAPPKGTSCEYGFFASYFDKDNGTTYAALRDTTFSFV